MDKNKMTSKNENEYKCVKNRARSTSQMTFLRLIIQNNLVKMVKNPTDTDINTLSISYGYF